MIAKLFRSRSAPPQELQASLPSGRRIYAVGDIHGRLDLLDRLLAMIAEDDAGRKDATSILVFLGDLIDRGPQSAQVVERLLQLEAARPADTTRFLTGNHEEVFLLALRGDERALRFFTRIGGRETILSYGIAEDAYRTLDFPELLQSLKARVPSEHIEFLSRFEDMIIEGDYVFVHAGIRPSEPLARQRVKDLRWIRDEFLETEERFEKVVVHGHTISEQPQILPHRIGLDTGAFASGQLTAMGLEGNDRWLLQTPPN